MEANIPKPIVLLALRRLMTLPIADIVAMVAPDQIENVPLAKQFMRQLIATLEKPGTVSVTATDGADLARLHFTDDAPAE